MKAERIIGNDVHDALNLVKEVFFAEGNLSLSRTAAKSFLEFLSLHGEELSWLGVYDGDLKGVLACDEDTLHLSLLFVRKEDRHKGIGTMLVEALKHLAKEKGIQRITVNALPDAIAFYAHAGFEKTVDEQSAGDMRFTLMEYICGKEALGKKVTVFVDHPYGSFHPILPDVVYTCNYGYVDGDASGDADLQNAYVYGVNEPVDTFTGFVIAIIYHRDETETRWVVSQSLLYDKNDVINAIGEMEQEYDTRIEWL